jgi:hypothetical protein
LIIITSVQISSKNEKYDRFSNCQTPYVKFLEYKNLTNLKYKIEIDDFSIREQSPSEKDIMIAIWVIGLIWKEFKKMYELGIRDYFNSSNSIISLSMNVLYFTSFAIQFYVIYLVQTNRQKVMSVEFWSDILNDTQNVDKQKEIFDAVYWLNSDRFFWLSDDPIHLANGCKN